MKIVLEINERDLVDAFKTAAATFGKSTLTKADMANFAAQFKEDLENYVCNDLVEFFENGINCDLYTDFYTHDDEEE